MNFYATQQHQTSRTPTMQNGSSPLNDEEVILKEAEHHFRSDINFALLPRPNNSVGRACFLDCSFDVREYASCPIFVAALYCSFMSLQAVLPIKHADLRICIPVISNEKRDEKPSRKPTVINPPAKPGRKISKGRRLPKTLHREEDRTAGEVLTA